MRQKFGDFFQDHYPALTPFVETQARTDFKAARAYAISLLDIHDTATGARAGRPPIQYEALKRSALILAVTAWESFVEDTVQQQLEFQLNLAASPSSVQSVFNRVANEWLSSDEPKRLTDKLINWTGDSWKNFVRASLTAKLEKFHTPNTENVDNLIERYLGHKAISKSWSWQGVSNIKAKKELDALIKVRGRAVHRGMRMHPMSQPEKTMKRQTVVHALNLIYNLVDSTEKTLNIAPKLVPTQPPPP